MILRSQDSIETVKLKGQIPLSSSLPIDLRVESHGDGVRFLDGLSEGNLSWEKGTSDFRLLIKGSIEKPQINGFLVIKEGEFFVFDKPLNNVNASIIFDFNRLEVKQLEANVA